MLAVPTTEESRPMMELDKTEHHEARAVTLTVEDVAVVAEETVTSIVTAVESEGEYHSN
jgi:hypothetical protein